MIRTTHVRLLVVYSVLYVLSTYEYVCTSRFRCVCHKEYPEYNFFWYKNYVESTAITRIFSDGLRSTVQQYSTVYYSTGRAFCIDGWLQKRTIRPLQYYRMSLCCTVDSVEYIHTLKKIVVVTKIPKQNKKNIPFRTASSGTYYFVLECSQKPRHADKHAHLYIHTRIHIWKWGCYDSRNQIRPTYVLYVQYN